MKNKLFFLFVLIYAYSWGQSQVSGTATYRFTVNGYVGFSGSGCGDNITGGLQWIAVQKQDNSHNTIIQGSASYPNNGNGIRDTGFSGDLDFSKANKIVKVKYRSARRERGTWGCKDTDYESHEHNINICNKIDYGFWGLNQPGNSTEIIKPIVTLNTPTGNNINISDEEYLTISLPDNIDNQFYNWEYSIGSSNNFVPFPSTYNQVPVLHIKGKDFLSGSDFGKTIFVRINMENCSSSPSTSNIIAFSYYKSAPHILSSSVTPARCFDSTDGTATLNFDRALLPDETLKVSLVNTDTGAAVLNQDLTDDLQTNTTYTLQNVAPGKYRLDLLGTYKGNATYTDSPIHSAVFEIEKPTPVTFNMTAKTDVYCFQGNDGIINIAAGGGQSQYQYKVFKDGEIFLDWTDFNNGNNTAISGLAAGIYKIKVRDSNECVAKDPSNTSIEKEITVTITQPSARIELPAAETEIVQPTGYGLSNGYISVQVIGGTPNTDGSYHFEWRKDTPDGAIISTGISTDAVNNPYTIKLANLSAGNYYLTVKDKNYASASSQLGNCGILSKEFIVDQPDLLVATIEVEKQISCNIANDYLYKLDLDQNGVPDEAEDGNLKAMVTGGVGAYSYQWQKLINGTFENLTGETQQILSNRSIGVYKVLVEDVNHNLADNSYTFSFPQELKVITSSTTISCYNQNGGSVSASASGGTGALSYQWNTGAVTPTVNGVTGGNYMVLVTDSKSCRVQKSIQIIEPEQIVISDISVKNPVCFGASNGEIKTTVSGGKAPYTIGWSHGETGTDIIGVPAGVYTITVTDANGCNLYKQYTLEDPAELTVDLGADITLCVGHTQTYNVAIEDPEATYQWKDTSGKVIGALAAITLSAAGTYTVTITDSKGCIATDTVKIKNSSDELDPQFMLATHAYSEASVVLVNTSLTKPQAVEWVIPTNHNIQVIKKTNEFLELKFLVPDTYEIGLKGIQGECVKTFYKKVVVEENTSGVSLNPAKSTNIKEFTILPNPNNGIFKVLVGLDNEAPVKVKIIDMLSHEVQPAVKRPASTFFTIPFNTSLPAGAYLVILETGNEALVKRMLVK